ncbi:MAG: extracellular solute-binding protein family 1 [Paenibacillus sp.]|jgi:multiple sugar transport system substrate-binding protein|nr:extracellular solute-binding protein family 1 [Paenibacillus sp.]
MLKSSWKGILVVTAAMTALSACGGGGKTASNKPEQDGKTKKADIIEPVELTVYNTLAGGSYDNMMRDFGEDIQKKYPNITFKYMEHGKGTTIQDIVAQKATVDIIISTQGKIDELAEAGLLSPISDLIKTYNFDLNRLIPSTLEPMKKTTGDIVGLPFQINTLALFYNKDLFNKFGVPFPKSQMTWDDLYNASKLLTRADGGVNYYGVVFGSYQNLLSLNQYSYELVDPKTKQPTFKDDFWKKYFDNFTRFYKLYEGIIPDPLKLNLDTFVKEQTVAMVIPTISNFPRGDVQWGFDWDIASYPTFQDRPDVGPPPAPTHLVVAGTSKHREAAFQAIAHVLSDEVQTKFAKKGRVSTLQNQTAANSFGADVPQLKGKQIGVLLPKKWAYPISWDKKSIRVQPPINQAFGDVLKGTKDPNTALQQAQEQAVKIVQDLDKK